MSSAAPEAAKTVCLIVEDRPDTRVWLARIVSDAFPATECTFASSVREARRWLGEHRSTKAALTMAVVDLGLPDGSGVEIIREISETFPEAAPIVATIYDDDLHLFDALAAGARGYLLKQDPPEQIAECLRRIEGGEPPLSPSIALRILDWFRAATPTPAPASELSDLTAREVEVLTHLSRGLSGPETAAVIGLRPQTVASYVKVIYQKLHVNSRAEAAILAARWGLV